MIVRFSLFVDWTGLLIKGYWQENRWKRENFEVFYFCSLLSNTLFIRKQNGLKYASKWKPYRANIVCKKWFLFQVEIKKKCYWNCWFGPSNQGPLKKWTEHSQELHFLKIHSRGPGGLLSHPGAGWGLAFLTMSFYNPKKFITRSF